MLPDLEKSFYNRDWRKVDGLGLSTVRRYVKCSQMFSVMIVVIVTSFSFLMESCKDVVTNPFSSTGNVICYEKLINNHWEIITNNVAGNSPHNISNYSDDDEYPKWSPDGKYIVYSRSQPLGGLLIIVYDKEKGTSEDISGGGGADSRPRWTQDNKVFFGYPHFWSNYHGTYLMDPDGSDRKKILDTTATIFFYNDSYTFIYIVDNKVYKTNIDNSFNELVLELPGPGSNDFVTVRDFNPLTGDLLVNTNILEDSPNAIATFNVDTKNYNLLISAEENYILYLQKYSSDFSKIVFIEHSSNDEYLSIYENSQKKRLVRIPASSPSVYFSYVPMEFSPDGKYIAFSKQIFHNSDSEWVSFSTPLFIVNVNDGTVHQLEEEAHGPSWNPQP